MDYREFLALNKYALEDEIHKTVLDKTKKNLMLIAMNLLSKQKKEEVTKIFRKFDYDETIKKESVGMEKGEASSSKKKFNYLMENVKGTSELFYRYYYIYRKQMKENHNKILSQFDKIEELKELKEKDLKTKREYDLLNEGIKEDRLMDNKRFGFDSEVDNLLRIYRRNRLSLVKTDIKKIVKKVSEVFEFKNIPFIMDDLKEAMEIRSQEEEKIRKKEEEEKAKEKERALKAAEEMKNTKTKGGKGSSVQETSVLPPGVNMSLIKVIRKKNKMDKTNLLGVVEEKEDKYVYEYEEQKDEDDDEENEDNDEEIEEMERKDEEDEETVIKKLFQSEEYTKSKYKEEIMLYLKYLLIEKKIGSAYSYEASNVETEKKIYNYLRSKIINKKFDMEELLKDDVFMRILSQNEMKDLNLSNVSHKKNIDYMIFDYLTELSSKSQLNTTSNDSIYDKYNRIKENYINSKSNYEKEKLLEEFDNEYARQFGFNNTSFIWDLKYNKDLNDTIKINNKVFPSKIVINSPQDIIKHEELLKSIILNYYKEYKIDYMYNYMNYFTDKYNTRKKVMELSANRVSLQEFNHLLTKFTYKISQTQAKNKQNPDGDLDYTNQIMINMNNGKVNRIENIFDIVNKIETENKDGHKVKFNVDNTDSFINSSSFSSKNQGKTEEIYKNTKENTYYNTRNTVSTSLPKSIKEKFEENKDLFDEDDKIQITNSIKSQNSEFLPSNYDNFEVEVYKQLNRDPYYKHHMFTFLSFQADKSNNFEEFNMVNTKIKKTVSQAYIADTSHISNLGMMSNFMKEFSDEEMIKYYDVSKKIKEMINGTEKSENVTNDSVLLNSEYEKIITSLEKSNNQNDVKPKISNTRLSKIEFSDNLIADVFRGMSDFKFTGTGKRKTSYATAVLSPGTGKILINGKPFHIYFTTQAERFKVLIPLRVTNLLAQVNVSIFVYGGGLTGQSEAIIPAISKSILKLNGIFENELNKKMAIIHDPRNVERKKRGLQKARKGQVYRRR